MKKIPFLCLTFLFLFWIMIFLTSAGFGIDNQNIPILRPMDTSSNGGGNITSINLTVNETQLELTEDNNLSIKTGWLTTFINSVSKWGDYFTKTESDSRYLQSYSEDDPIYSSENSTIARIGNCPEGYVVQNTTTSGVECIEMSAEGGNPFDQSLNTTDNVTFNSINVSGGKIYYNGTDNIWDFS